LDLNFIFIHSIGLQPSFRMVIDYRIIYDCTGRNITHDKKFSLLSPFQIKIILILPVFCINCFLIQLAFGEVECVIPY
jgi:hypothetical protein